MVGALQAIHCLCLSYHGKAGPGLETGLTLVPLAMTSTCMSTKQNEADSTLTSGKADDLLSIQSVPSS